MNRSTGLILIGIILASALVVRLNVVHAAPKATSKAKTETKPEAIKQPNVLWIISEDMGPELSCYGTPQVQTPYLDALASVGMRFTRAFTVTPVCSTSRSSFMTGMYAMTIGAHNHRSHRNDGFELPNGVRLLTHWLQDHKYFTANIVHLTDDPKEKFYRGTGKTDWNFKVTRKPYDSNKWSDLKKNQPFYAQINFPETHRGGAWNNAHKFIKKTADPAKVKLPPYYPDHPVARKDWAQYLNAVMALDKKVGFVLKQLVADGLAHNTVIIFFGDHGRAMVRGKQWPYDSGLHVPLIIFWPTGLPAPEGYEAGTVSDRLVASIDLMATTMDIVGLDKPRVMEGNILFGPNADAPRKYVFGGRDRGDETVDRIRTVRDKRYRYIRNFYPDRPFLQINRYKEYQYPVIPLMRYLNEKGKLTDVQARLLAPTRPKEELYDLDKDPYEINNLVESAEHQNDLKRLRGDLEDWLVEIDDKGRFPEDPKIIEAWKKNMMKNYDARIKTRTQQLRKEFEQGGSK